MQMSGLKLNKWIELHFDIMIYCWVLFCKYCYVVNNFKLFLPRCVFNLFSFCSVFGLSKLMTILHSHGRVNQNVVDSVQEFVSENNAINILPNTSIDDKTIMVS